MKKDYYDILGLKKSASDRDIKRAFRKLALKYHPDKNKDAKAEEIFREIAEAYSVLSDEGKRKKYDSYGHAAFDTSHGTGSGGEAPFGHHFNMNDFFKHFDDAFHFRSGNQRHQQNRHGHQNNHGSPFGFNFDDLFDGMDSDDFGSFFANHQESHNAFQDFHPFGGGDSFFGNHFGGGHQQAYSFSYSSHSGGGSNCKKVTKRVGNTVMTSTVCS